MNRAARRRVAITGLGLVCSQGQDPVAVFDAWCSGVSGTGTHTAGEGEHVATIAAAACSGFDAASTLPRGKLAAMDRVSQLSTVAAMAAWDDAGLQELSDESRDEAGVFWGTGAGGTQATERSYRDLFLRGRDRISPLSVVLASCWARVRLRLCWRTTNWRRRGVRESMQNWPATAAAATTTT